MFSSTEELHASILNSLQYNLAETPVCLFCKRLITSVGEQAYTENYPFIIEDCQCLNQTIISQLWPHHQQWHAGLSQSRQIAIKLPVNIHNPEIQTRTTCVSAHSIAHPSVTHW